MKKQNPDITTFGLLRHGQTEWNTVKKIQGSRNSPLTAYGRKQTARWAHFLKKFNWNRIVASDLGRVRETVAILNEQLDVPAEFDNRLREQNWGEWEGLTISHVKAHFGQELEKRVKKGWAFRAPGGETRQTVKERAFTALHELAGVYPGENILVVCHQGVIKCTLYAITGRKFLPSDDPLLNPDMLHLITGNGCDLQTHKLNIPCGDKG
ncbi:histidine phosphatase family protein [Desulfomarina sp.]